MTETPKELNRRKFIIFLKSLICVELALFIYMKCYRYESTTSIILSFLLFVTGFIVLFMTETSKESNRRKFIIFLKSFIYIGLALYTYIYIYMEEHFYKSDTPVIYLSYLLLFTGYIALFISKTRLLGFISFIVLSVPHLPLLIMILGGGGGWGRPLRINGKQVHPELCEGKGWAKGEHPDIAGLDEATCRALEALWLHDAQKEHASVPAFARISWLLAAVGAPAKLMEWAHQAGLEEIEHARLCFALAAGYGGRTHTVKPMPELLRGGLDCKADPMVILATESLDDGCLLEDFNADVAAQCALVCEEPVTRGVLEQIAKEERSHANFSWALLIWTLEREPEKIVPAIKKTLANIGKYQRPTAVGADKKQLVDLADPVQMRKHGRITDERWQELWDIRLEQTRQRLNQMLDKI